MAKGDLRPLLMDTLSPDSVRRSGLLNAKPDSVRRSGLLNAKFVSQTVKQFEDDSLHYTDLVWKMLMLQ